MKALHRDDLWCWSRFDADRDIDFHSVLWVRAEGNVLIDPLPLDDHDRTHLAALGGARWIVVTNRDHVRDTTAVATATGAEIAGPIGERETLALPCARWLGDGDEPFDGLRVLALEGSKTPGELALLLDGTTLITGDLIRSHRGGELCLLPDARLSDPARARRSVRALIDACPDVDAVVPCDGWPIFRDGAGALRDLGMALGDPGP